MSDDPASARDGTLLLFPTELEQRRFDDQGGLDPRLAEPAVCGFGVAAAAARAMQLIEHRRPARLILLGIAGAYDVERHPVGSAWAFERVAVDGIGAGSGAEFRGPSRLGFPQWPGLAGDPESAIREELALSPGGDTEARADLLLTTCAASDSDLEARERLARHPDAVAEDMEGFAVALAGALAGVPVTIVRGISNRVGDRDPKRWRIPAALASARRVLHELLAAAPRENGGEPAG